MNLRRKGGWFRVWAGSAAFRRKRGVFPIDKLRVSQGQNDGVC